jgi:hypothetical protein
MYMMYRPHPHPHPRDYQPRQALCHAFCRPESVLVAPNDREKKERRENKKPQLDV